MEKNKTNLGEKFTRIARSTGAVILDTIDTIGQNNFYAAGYQKKEIEEKDTWL